MGHERIEIAPELRGGESTAGVLVLFLGNRGEGVGISTHFHAHPLTSTKIDLGYMSDEIGNELVTPQIF